MSAMIAEHKVKATVDAADTAASGKKPAAGHKQPVRYLSRTGVATHLKMAGLHSLTGVELPEPDIIIGDPKNWGKAHKGWTVETIDEWQANRPGRGRWGPRNVTPTGETPV
jgi:hypothetical protein